MRTSFPFIISATALIASTYGLTRFGYGLFVPAFNQSFSLTPTLVGGISGGSFISYCVAAAGAYRMARLPRATVCLAGGLAVVGSVGVAVSGSAVVLAVSMLIAGAGAGFASPGLVALVQEKVGSAVEARAQAVVNSGTGFGVVVAGPLALLLAAQWRTAWWVIAAINAAATLAVLASSRRASTTAAAAPGRRFPLGELKPLRTAAVAALLAGVSSAAVWTFGRSVVTTEGGLSDPIATGFWLCLGAAGIAGALSGDVVTRWGLRAAWSATALLMGSATLVIGMLPSSAMAVYAGGAVFGASYVALSGVLIAWASAALPDRAAAGTAALFITLALGQAVGALLIGGLMDQTTALAAFGTAAALAGCSLIPGTRPLPALDLAGAPARAGGPPA